MSRKFIGSRRRAGRRREDVPQAGKERLEGGGVVRQG